MLNWTSIIVHSPLSVPNFPEFFYKILSVYSRKYTEAAESSPKSPRNNEIEEKYESEFESDTQEEDEETNDVPTEITAETE